MKSHRALVTVFAILCAAGPAAAQDAPAPQIPQIVTRGDATVRRAPDRAFVVAAVEARAKAPRDAQRQNAEAMTAVQQRLTAAGVPRDAIRTLGYSLQQEFDFANGRRTPRDYFARNSIEVRLDDVEKVGEIADLAVQAGATNIANIRFDLKDRAGAEREALRLAVVDARARAEAAATGAGRAIDRVLRIDDSGQNEPPRPMTYAATMRASAPDQAAPTPIEAGEIEIHAQVTLTVSIK